MKTIDTLGEDFVRKHDWLLGMAKINEVAICGGCAAAICKGRQDYAPADLDLVTTKANALRLLDNINHFLIERSIHYRVYVNSRNAFVPAPAVSHFRIQTPFWLPVCLFVVPHDAFRFYRIQGGHLLQLPQDVKQAADHMTEMDERPRLASEPFEDEPSFEYEEKPDVETIDWNDFDQWSRDVQSQLPELKPYPKP